MFSFMIEKETAVAYQAATEQSLKVFKQKDPARMARLGGGWYHPERSSILLPSLGQLLEVKCPEGTVNFKETSFSPLWQWSLITTNYLGQTKGSQPTGNLISFRELEGGQTFFPAFQNNTVSRLNRLPERADLVEINNACLQLGGELSDRGDAGARINFFPRFPITVLFWKGDEEVSSSASLLFDENANCYLHTEDIAVAGALVAYFLSRLCIK